MPTSTDPGSTSGHRRAGNPGAGAATGALLALAGVVAWGTAWGTAWAAETPGLRAQIAALADAHGFAVTGLQRIGTETARSEPPGTLGERIRTLLTGYNYVLVDDATGAPRELYVTSARQPAAAVRAREHAVPLSRAGAHQSVSAVLSGPDGRRHELTLLIDTGASDVVLPASMIPTFGFDPARLRAGTARTANGDAPAHFARLDSVRIGTATARDVPVTFIDDARLGSLRLLGMSFLGRFSVTLDDAEGRMVLIER